MGINDSPNITATLPRSQCLRAAIFCEIHSVTRCRAMTLSNAASPQTKIASGPCHAQNVNASSERAVKCSGEKPLRFVNDFAQLRGDSGRSFAAARRLLARPATPTTPAYDRNRSNRRKCADGQGRVRRGRMKKLAPSGGHSRGINLPNVSHPVRDAALRPRRVPGLPTSGRGADRITWNKAGSPSIVRICADHPCTGVGAVQPYRCQVFCGPCLFAHCTYLARSGTALAPRL